VGAFEAKTHLSELLDEVSAGETILITRQGKPAARSIPPAEEAPIDYKKLTAEILEARSRRSLGGLKIVDIIRKSRRY